MAKPASVGKQSDEMKLKRSGSTDAKSPKAVAAKKLNPKAGSSKSRSSASKAVSLSPGGDAPASPEEDTAVVANDSPIPDAPPTTVDDAAEVLFLEQDEPGSTRSSTTCNECLPGRTSAAYFTMCFSISSTYSALAVVLWSNMGWAPDTMKFLEDTPWLFYVFSGVSMVILSILYFLDFFWPPHRPGQYLVLWTGDPGIGRCALVISIVCLICACLFTAADYPYVPLLVTVFLNPASVLFLRVQTNVRTGLEGVTDPEKLDNPENHAQRMQILRGLTANEQDSYTFHMASMLSYLSVAIGVLVAWLVWSFTSDDGFTVFHATLSSDEENQKRYIMWSAPLTVACSNLTFFVLVLLRVVTAKSYEATNDLKNKLIVDMQSDDLGESSRELMVLARLSEKQRTTFIAMDTTKKKDYLDMHKKNMSQITGIFKIAGCAVVTMVGTFYVVSELVAADSHVAMMFQAFLGFFFLTFFAFVYISFRRLLTAMSSWIYEIPLYRMGVSISRSPWIKAVAFTFGAPLIPIIVVVSAINQAVRKFRDIEGKIVDDSKSPNGGLAIDSDAHPAVTDGSTGGSGDTGGNVNSGQVLTKRVHNVVESMKEWDWLAMTFRVYVISIVLVIYVLSPRALNVFLAWLNSKLSTLNFYVILVMLWFSGMCCFLLPPVPGVPVYIFGGMIVGDQCPQGFWAGVVMCIAICFVMKLCACAMQQKLIGEMLSNSILVKQQCGIHKAPIRAIECVLRQKGWTVGKVAILCGGPDWPTSVMAGLLKLPLPAMLFGTLPIIAFIAPCVMTGSFYLRKDESEMWSRSGTLMMSLTMIVNIILWALAGWAIQEQVDKNHEFITRPMEKYLQLDWLDYKQQQIQKSAGMTMKDVPFPLQAIYVYFAFISMCIGLFMFWAPNTAFGDFAVTGDIEDLEWTGSNGIFKDSGLYGCIGSAVCLLVAWSFGKWKSFKMKSARDAKALELIDTEQTWKEERIQLAQQAAEASKQNAKANVRAKLKGAKMMALGKGAAKPEQAQRGSACESGPIQIRSVRPSAKLLDKE